MHTSHALNSINIIYTTVIGKENYSYIAKALYELPSFNHGCNIMMQLYA